MLFGGAAPGTLLIAANGTDEATIIADAETKARAFFGGDPVECYIVGAREAGEGYEATVCASRADPSRTPKCVDDIVARAAEQTTDNTVAAPEVHE